MARKQRGLQTAIAIVHGNVDTVLSVLGNCDTLGEAGRDAEEDDLLKTHGGVCKVCSGKMFVRVVERALVVVDVMRLCVDDETETPAGRWGFISCWGPLKLMTFICKLIHLQVLHPTSVSP